MNNIRKTRANLNFLLSREALQCAVKTEIERESKRERERKREREVVRKEYEGNQVSAPMSAAASCNTALDRAEGQ